MMIEVSNIIVINVFINNLDICKMFFGGKIIFGNLDSPKYVVGVKIKWLMPLFRYKSRYLGEFDKVLLSLSRLIQV